MGLHSLKYRSHIDIDRESRECDNKVTKKILFLDYSIINKMNLIHFPTGDSPSIYVTVHKLYGLWNPKVQCSIYKGSAIIPILGRNNPIPCIDIYLRSVLILSSHLSLGFPNDLFPVRKPAKILKVLPPSSILATRPAHLNLLDLITLIILDERYKLLSYSLWSLLHSTFSSLLGPNIRLRIPSACIPLLM